MVESVDVKMKGIATSEDKDGDEYNAVKVEIVVGKFDDAVKVRKKIESDLQHWLVGQSMLEGGV